VGKGRERETLKKQKKSFLLKLAVCAFAVYIATTLLCQTIRIRESSAQLALLKDQVSDAQKKNAQTQRLLNESNDKLMESVARDDLGYAKPNERIFVDASGN
jgi:cell division protein FtsB